jgi:outer membrane immunogenic protein
MRVTATTVLCALAASTTQAAGPEPVETAPVIAAAPVAAPSWEGGYVGVQLGYAYGDFDIDRAFDGEDDDDGFIGGFTAGYLWDLGNGWYLGPEFQYDWADLEITDATTGDTASFDEIARLKLIAGYEVAQGNGLVFGSAGIAYGSLDNVGDIFDGFDGSDTNWLLGVGYEHRVSQNWSIGGEYMYHDFSDINVNTLHLRAMYRF